METWSDLHISVTCQIPNLRHYYEKYLQPKDGVFVEVGAFDGDSWSNTSGLADGGWSGVYIEPIPTYAQLCRNRHPGANIRVIQCAISSEQSDLTLEVGGPLSTASSETKTAYSSIEWARGVIFSNQIKVSAYPLDLVLQSLKIPQFFDLLVVDVEGFEEKVFSSFNLTWWKPKMMIVELNDYHKSFASTPELQYSSARLRNLILANEYMQVYADAINTIFVSKILWKEV
jgi:FkbM family methyltransferase